MAKNLDATEIKVWQRLNAPDTDNQCPQTLL